MQNKIQIQVRLCKSNPQFTNKDTNRPMFYNKEYADKNNLSEQECKETLKNLWVENNFEQPIMANFDELSTLKAKINVGYLELDPEKAKAKSYCMVTIAGFNRFYFITSARIGNNKAVEYMLELDTITTYLDQLKYNHKSAYISRRHETRWIISEDKTTLQPNFDEESLLWNVDPMTSNYTTIYNKHLKVDVLTLESWVGTAAGNAIRDTFWPVAIMNGKDYSKAQGTNDSQQFNLHWLSAFAYNPISMNRSFTSLMLLNPFDYTTGILGTNLAWADSWAINSNYSTWINKIYALPLPLTDLWITRGGGTSGNGPIIVPNMPMVEIDAQNILPNNAHLKYKIPNPSLIAYDGSYAETDDAAWEPKTYEWICDKKELGLSLPATKLSDARNWNLEAKLLAPEHRRVTLNSVTGSEFEIMPEFLFTNFYKPNFKLTINQFVGGDGAYQLIRIVDETTSVVKSLYEKESKINGRTFIVPYYDQVPNASSKYYDFMNTQGESYKTSLAVNKGQMALGVVSGALKMIGGGVGGMLSANPLGAGMGAMTAAQGATDIISSVANGIMREKTIKSANYDREKQGTTNLIENYSFIKDTLVSSLTDFGDSKLAVVIREHPLSQKASIADYYNKFGYPADRLEYINSYSWFSKRSLFTYIESPRISDAFDLSNLSPEIQSNLDGLFDLGVRLWTIDETGDTTNINNYISENLEWELKKLYKELHP